MYVYIYIYTYMYESLSLYIYIYIYIYTKGDSKVQREHLQKEPSEPVGGSDHARVPKHCI